MIDPFFIQEMGMDEYWIYYVIWVPGRQESPKSGCFGCGCLTLIVLIIVGYAFFHFVLPSNATSGYYATDLKVQASGSALDSYWGSDGSEHVNYISVDGHVHELFSSAGGNWGNNDLTTMSKGTPALAGSALTAYTTTSGGEHVEYIGTDHHIHELYYAPGQNWGNNDLTALGGGVAPNAGSMLVGYVGSNGSEHINFIGTDHHVHELYYPTGGNWSNNDLTALGGGTTPASGSALAGYVGSDGSVHVNYIGSDGHIHELYYPPGGGWTDNDLTSLGGGATPVAGSALAGYWGSDSSVHINYIGSDGHVHELYYPPGGSWTDRDLSASTKNTTPLAGSALVGYQGGDGNEYLNFIGEDKDIDQIYT
jgi:hypothetical protein